MPFPPTRAHLDDPDETASETGELLPHAKGTTPPSGGTRLYRGFLAYTIACEVFSVVSLGLFLPVVLEQLARENGRLAPDYAQPCPMSASEPTDGGDAQRCAVRLLGSWLDTASFSLYTYSASVLIQALLVISLGTLADNPFIRHRLLTTFGTVGSLFTISFLLLPPSSPVWWISALLALVANVSFGASMVCLNSYLPELGRRNPIVLAKLQSLEDARETLKTVQASPERRGDDLLVASQELVRAQDEYAAEKAMATSEVSSTGVALGYAAGISLLVLMLVPVTLMHGSTLSLRCAIAGSGLWWGIGTIPASYWLRPDETIVARAPVLTRGIWGSAAEGWKGLGLMLQDWRRLPATFIFLAAWFLLSDAFATMTSTAMLFAKTSLSMSTSALIIISVISPAAGIAGAILFPRLQKTVLLWTNLYVLLFLVALACLIPLSGILALRSQWEMYVVAVVFGALYGSFQSYARTCFSELVPGSQSARWFGLYSITDKSSSFLGPLLVATITTLTSNIRYGFWLILGMLVFALPILARVNMDKGRNDAESYDRELVLSTGVTDVDERDSE
ncbi:autophagy-related protein 22 [Pseudohyphozyma bogoriensis]|nr:autophagy-related protein 22 [Pseudohyphozyma bogoriensis]